MGNPRSMTQQALIADPLLAILKGRFAADLGQPRTQCSKTLAADPLLKILTVRCVVNLGASPHSMTEDPHH